jgi:predicted esterase
MLMPLGLLISSCSGKSAKANEPEVATMDSVSTELEKNNKDLDEQTKKLEASLEQAEKETETAK